MKERYYQSDSFNQEMIHLMIPDMHVSNIQAKNVGIALRKKQNVKELIEVLNRDKESVELCVRDIIGFINIINAKEIGKTDIIHFTLI